MNIVNVTPHEVVVYTHDTPDTLPDPAPSELGRYAPSAIIARAAQTRRDIGTLEGVPVGISEYGSPHTHTGPTGFDSVIGGPVAGRRM